MQMLYPAGPAALLLGLFGARMLYSAGWLLYPVFPLLSLLIYIILDITNIK
jgi:hypothetical protein